MLMRTVVVVGVVDGNGFVRFAALGHAREAAQIAAACCAAILDRGVRHLVDLVAARQGYRVSTGILPSPAPSPLVSQWVSSKR